MDLGNRDVYRRQRMRREAASGLLSREWVYMMLLFGSMGAITWAMRGTSGWGGMDGTILPGMMWGLLWYYVCRRNGIDARGLVLWLGLGIALGGMLGYGQYVSWIRGEFSTTGGKLPISPWWGYTWFAITGIGWGAPGGILLGWTLHGKASPDAWLARLLVPLGCAFLASKAVQAWPAFFFPHYAECAYATGKDPNLLRTVDTNTQNFVVLVWWLGAMGVAAMQRDRAALAAGAIIGGGFGLGFPLSALWCLGYKYAPEYIDWWKMWEMNAGFFLGLLYVLALRWAVRRTDCTHTADGAPLGLDTASTPAAQQPVHERRRALLFVFSVFTFFTVLLFGTTFRMGAFLQLYDPKVVGQYAWPLPRVILFLVLFPFVLVPTLLAVRRAFRGIPAVMDRRASTILAARMIDLMTITAAAGALTIWPEEIGVFYAMFLALAVFASTRLNTHFDSIGA